MPDHIFDLLSAPVRVRPPAESILFRTGTISWSCVDRLVDIRQRLRFNTLRLASTTSNDPSQAASERADLIGESRRGPGVSIRLST